MAMIGNAHGDDACMARMLTLTGGAARVILECPADGGAPIWRYWGRDFDDAGLIVPDRPLSDSRPLPSFTLDQASVLSVLPTFGLGWFGAPGLRAATIDGRDFAHLFRLEAVDQPHAGSMTMLLADHVADLSVRLTMALDSHGVLRTGMMLTNHGDAPLRVDWLASACLPLPPGSRWVDSYSGRHNAEFVPCRDALGRAGWSKTSRRGLTGHDCFPGAYVDTDQGVYAAQLVATGNHHQQIESTEDGGFQWQLGAWFAPGEVTLAAGDHLSTPDVIAAYSPVDANAVAAQFHAHLRDRKAALRSPRPVHLNSWEGYYFDHDEARMKALADAAADVGVERFILDDGWFHGRDDDRRALGDWWADARKYPNGLKPLADHVVSRGMEFGLWVEPEMVNTDSDLYRAHPDWVLQLAGRPMITGRNQLVLDMARDDVRDYLYQTLSSLLTALPIAYLKWDHNRDLASTGGQDGRASYQRQTRGTMALIRRLRDDFPRLEIEACAGGGGRIDAAMAELTDRFWTSDCIDALSRLRMQRGFLRFLPPHMMGSHIGASPAHTTGRRQGLDFRAAVACQGHFGLEFDLVAMPESERVKLRWWINFYKQWRHLLHTDVWTGEADDGIVWHAAGSQDEWLLFVYRIEPMTMRHQAPLRLSFVGDTGVVDIATLFPVNARLENSVPAGWLRHHGIDIPPMKAERVIIFHGKRRTL